MANKINQTSNTIISPTLYLITCKVNMNNTQVKNRLIRALKVAKEGDKALLVELTELSERIDEIYAELLGKLDAVKVRSGDKGEKGDKGDKGEHGIPGKNGKDGRDGRDGKDGLDGADGKDGKDGNIKELSPDEIRDSLELLQGDERLDKKAIKGLDEEFQRLEKVRGGGGVTNMRIIQAFKYILKTESPTGAINGVNTEYTVSQPIFAVLSFSLNGVIIAQLPNYTIKGNKIIFSAAIPADYSGKDFEVKYV